MRHRRLELFQVFERNISNVVVMKLDQRGIENCVGLRYVQAGQRCGGPTALIGVKAVVWRLRNWPAALYQARKKVTAQALAFQGRSGVGRTRAGGVSIDLDIPGVLARQASAVEL
jgi:hypothetical protein